MSLNDHFRQALEELDVPLLRKLWGHVAPKMPQPGDDEDILRKAHYARTIMDSVHFDRRAYSHAWLSERALPSGLPDILRPRAQRMYPITVGSVGISVCGTSELGRAAAPLMREAMEYAVNEAYADGHRNEPAVVKNRMMEMRRRVIKKLIG